MSPQTHNEEWAMLQEMGMGANDLLAAGDGNVESMSGVSKSGLRSAWQTFERFFEYQRDNDTIDIFPGHPSCANDLLNDDAEELDYGTLAAFMMYWVGSSRGYLGENITLKTALIYFDKFRRSYASQCKRTLAPKVCTDIVGYIKNELSIELNIENQRAPVFFTGLDTIRKVSEALWSEELTVSTRPRIQTLFIGALIMQCGKRVASFLPSEDQRSSGLTTTWGDLGLRITASDDNGEPNALSLRVSSPFDKTGDNIGDTVLLGQTDEKWSCPVFLSLLLAHLDNALPNNLSINALLDRRMLDGQPTLDLEFAATGKGLAVMRLNDDNPGKQPEHWHAASPYGYWKKASRLVGLEVPLSGHRIRRSAAIDVLIRGGTIEDVQIKLGHIFRSRVTRAYIKSFTVDATVALFNDGDVDREALLRNLTSNPRYLKAEAKAMELLNIGAAGRARIFATTEVIDAEEALDDATEAARIKYGSIDNAPVKVKEAIEVKYRAWQYQYQSARNNERRRLWDEKQERLAEQGIVGEGGHQIDIDQPTVDDLPDRYSSMDYNHLPYQLFLSTNELDSENVRNLIIAESDTDRNLAQNTIANEDSHEEVVPIAIPTSFNANDPLDGRTTLFDQAWRILSNRIPMAYAQAADVIAELPERVGEVIHYPIGIHPLPNDLCPGCFEPIRSCVTSNAGKGLQKGKRATDLNNYALAKARHVTKCVCQHVYEANVEAIIAKYPSTLPRCPMSAIALDSEDSEDGENEKAPAPKSWTFTFGRHLAKIVQSSPVKCNLCDNDTTFKSFATARAHLFGHGILIPMVCSFRKVFPGGTKGVWNAKIMGLDDAMYIEADRRFIVDPSDLEAWSEHSFQTRIAAASATDGPYSVCADLLDAAETLPLDALGTDSDSKYLVDKPEQGRLKSPGLCFVCVYDTDLAYAQRMKPYTTDTQWQPHISQCLSHCFSSIKAYYNDIASLANGQPYPDNTHFVNGILACPDLSCRARSRTFSSAIEYARHITAVHQIKFRRSGLRKSRAQMSLSDLCFANEDDLETWLSIAPEHAHKAPKQPEGATVNAEAGPSRLTVMHETESIVDGDAEENQDNDETVSAIVGKGKRKVSTNDGTAAKKARSRPGKGKGKII